MLDGTEPPVRLTVNQLGLPSKSAARVLAAADLAESWLALWPDILLAAFGSSVKVEIIVDSGVIASVQRMPTGIEVRVAVSPDDLAVSAGQIASTLMSNVITALGQSDAFADMPARVLASAPAGDQVPAPPGLIAEVRHLQTSEMAVMAKRDDSRPVPDYRYRLDVFLQDVLATRVRSVDGDGDIWRIRLL